MNGQIIKILSNDYTVMTDDKSRYLCKVRGKFRNMKVTPLVGDYVSFDNKIINEIKPRRNELIRPRCANIDQLIIVASTKNPDFDTNLLDKLLAISEFNRIKPIIILSKLDLLSTKEYEDLKPLFNYYKKIGYKVIENTDLDQIRGLIKDNISVITGQSGAGKSTLLNHLDSNLNIKTNEISMALGRGKHTTRHTELIDLSEGLIADTPGFSSLQFIDMTKEDIRDNFIDFQELREGCKYKDCMHVKEDDCLIKDYVKEGKIPKERYENYVKFIKGE